jgi:hypothetical protein
VAIALRDEKYCGIIATDGIYKHPLPTPTQKAWARSTCQYSVHTLKAMKPTTIRIDPVATKT